AGMTGGRSFRARDTDAPAGIYSEIDRLEPVEAPGEALRPRLERYHWPLALALACGLLAAGLAWRRARACCCRSPSCTSCVRLGCWRCCPCRCWPGPGGSARGDAAPGAP